MTDQANPLMSAERLAEIAKGIECGQMWMDEDEALCAIRDLLSDNALLRARLAEALEIVRAVADRSVNRLRVRPREHWIEGRTWQYKALAFLRSVEPVDGEAER